MVEIISSCKDAATPALVWGSGNDGANSLGILWSLAPLGVPVYFLRQIPCERRFVHLSRFCKGVFQATSDEPIAEQLVRIAQSLGTRPVLFCTADKTVLDVAENFDVLSQWYYLPVPSPDTLINLLDKQTLHRIAKKAGLRVPETHFPTNLAEARALAPTLSYPVIIKPISSIRIAPGSRMRELKYKALKAQGAKDFLLLVQPLFEEGTGFMVQHYIPGGDENVLVFLAASGKDGRLIAGCTGRKLHQYPPGAGVMASGELCELPDVYSAGERFLNYVRYTGLSGVEFKRHPETKELYFIEMSARTENFHRLAFVGGYNQPAVVYADTLGLALPPLPAKQREGKWIWFLADFLAARQGIKEGKLSWSDYFRTLAGRHEWAYFWWKDPLPWVGYMGGMAIEALKKVMKKQ